MSHMNLQISKKEKFFTILSERITQLSSFKGLQVGEKTIVNNVQQKNNKHRVTTTIIMYFNKTYQKSLQYK